MDRQALDALVDQLNAGLGEITPYKLAVVAPHELRPAERNARYMTRRQMTVLSANVRKDKNLQSVPFCWRRADGSFVIVSGHHRVEAAADAGVEAILILYTDASMSEPERIAAQLAHNAIVGQDNPTVLLDLWARIDDLRLKVYTGLDDALLQTMRPVEVKRLSESHLLFEEIALTFVSAEIAQIEETLKRLAGLKRRRWVADAQDFDRFFDTLLTFKEAANVFNTSTAIKAMTEIAQEWIAAHEQEVADGDD